MGKGKKRLAHSELQRLDSITDRVGERVGIVLCDDKITEHKIYLKWDLNREEFKVSVPRCPNCNIEQKALQDAKERGAKIEYGKIPR